MKTYQLLSSPLRGCVVSPFMVRQAHHERTYDTASDGGGLSPEPCEVQGIALHPTWCRGGGGHSIVPPHPLPLPCLRRSGYAQAGARGERDKGIFSKQLKSPWQPG